MHALERTHPGQRDLEWLPPSYLAIRWTVAGGIWGGLLLSAVALTWFAHFNLFLFGKGLAVLGGGGYLAGDRVARAALRGRLRKLAHGDVDLARLPAEPDGELVHVVGRVRKLREVLGLVAGEPACYRRTVLSLGTQRVVHEAAEDFWLVSEDRAEPILVEVERSRLIAPEGPRRAIDAAHASVRAFEALELPTEARDALYDRRDRMHSGRPARDLAVTEVLVRDGDEVEIVGYKSRIIDPTVSARLGRDDPFRATLRGGDGLPLLISPR